MENRPYYLQQASACFNKIADIFRGSSGTSLPFWHVGRTLNTCNDYITQNAASVSADVERYNREVRPWCACFYSKQAGASDNQTWWWDDYGWWGLAHLATGDLERAKDCWNRMNAYGVGGGQTGPDYRGGVWNHTTQEDPPGCENSVTNSLFFLLSLRFLNDALFNTDPLRKDVLAAATGWARWLDHWLGRPRAILNPLQLLRERPVGDSNDVFRFGAPTYEVGWIWSGDQGLALAWAAEAFGLAPADWDAVFAGSPYRARALEMASQIQGGMAPLFDVDGVLHEAPYSANSKGNYNVDYCTGRGVFMRYVSRADRVFRQEPGWITHDAQSLNTADAVIARLAEPSPTMYSWSYSKEQAILNAWRARLSGNAEGDPCLCSDARLSIDATPQLVFYGIALDVLTAATAVARP